MATKTHNIKSLKAVKKKDDKRGTNPRSLENLTPWKPGIPSPNPGGKPRKSEELLSGAYLRMLKSKPPAELVEGLTKWHGDEPPQTNAEAHSARMNMLAAKGNVPALRELREATEGSAVHIDDAAYQDYRMAMQEFLAGDNKQASPETVDKKQDDSPTQEVKDE